MSEARTQILTSIRRSLKRDTASPEMTSTVENRLKDHARNLVPQRSNLSPSDRVDLFVSMATEVAATVERLPNLSRVPHAVADYLASQNLPAEVKVAPDPQLETIPWDKRPTLTVDRGRAADRDLTSVTGGLRRDSRDRDADDAVGTGTSHHIEHDAGHPYRSPACRSGGRQLRGWLGRGAPA